MDANKRLRLNEIGYEFRHTCGRCVYAELSHDGWGTCALYSYEHLKHKEERQLSIHRSGWCPSYVRDDATQATNAHYQEWDEGS